MVGRKLVCIKRCFNKSCLGKIHRSSDSGVSVLCGCCRCEHIHTSSCGFILKGPVQRWTDIARTHARTHVRTHAFWKDRFLFRNTVSPVRVTPSKPSWTKLFYGQRIHLLPGSGFDLVNPSHLRVNLSILEQLSSETAVFGNFVFRFFSLQLSGINLGYFVNRNIWEEIHELKFNIYWN